MDVAMADVRFPAMTIFGAMYLLPGAVYGGVVSITSGEDIAVGVIVLIAVGVLVVGSQVLLAKFVLPLTFFEPYPCPHPTAFVFERVAMLPASRWVPESMERRFMPLLGTRSRAWSLLSVADLLLALCLSAATGVGVGTKGAACSVMPVLVAAIYFSCALLHIVLRPYRRPIDTFVFPAVWVLFGILCILKYMNTSGHEDLIDKMQLALSTLQLFQTACAVVVFVRERQWRVFIQRGIDEGHDEWKPQIRTNNLMLSDGDDRDNGLASLMKMESGVDNHDDDDDEEMFDVLSNNDLTSSLQRRGRRDRSNSMSAAQQAVVEEFWRTNWQTSAAVASASLRADRRSASNGKEVSDVVRALRLATRAEVNGNDDDPHQRQHEEDDDDDVDVGNMLLSWQLPTSPEEEVFVEQLGDGLELSDDDIVDRGPRRIMQPLTFLSPPPTDAPAIFFQRSTVLSAKGRSAGRKKTARQSTKIASYDDI
ncbi:transmembrane protein, putative [Bodo saltans]|uniref:Transmembrane protein, putative n=1 Tax=Bodo saltans TaxID=75058 RepID=A0A0S4IXX9_BODSA|nr:transmembrane protein, putative [Bodo saltans]|eukprot:CUG48654.1 transmembrane protein, putative [Bodo saltans]